MTNLPEIFGSMVFGDKVMKERLSAKAYSAVKESMESGATLSTEVAKEVATAMKDWAISLGATHYTHWFQPMTGITAEKHDSFIEPTKSHGVIMNFSWKSLVKGESDASSFPSGGLRSVFEARGYTAWDPTSYAFVKDAILYIPTAFCTYDGQALDKKTPLLRSLQAINKQSLRILKLFGNDTVKRVIPTVGAEQEYFLIDKSVYEKREDLINCGRTLFGARPPKGQELNDHYYGAIKPRVLAFMQELEENLWKLGVYAKTRHNEAAPAQHELAPYFCNVNMACDHNQLTMELMKTIANKHDLVCLLHEKPFAGINGSGKHNNWSLTTDTGENLFDPGETPQSNAQFLLFLLAVVKGVYEYQDLLRISVASASNDYRLGATEAPPAIMSIYLGDELEDIFDAIMKGKSYSAKKDSELKIGVSALPPIPKDSTDRNRTSPFAFTGNKFEFRSVGSSENIACPNFILNTIVAEELCQFADRLENAKDFNVELNALIKNTISENENVIFNGNNYSDSWFREASKRKLLNLATTVDALPYYVKDKNVKLFEKHGVLSKSEIKSRMEILLENYADIIHIEALTTVDMAYKDIIPSILGYEKYVSETIREKKRVSGCYCFLEEKLLSKVSANSNSLSNYLDRLVNTLDKYSYIDGALNKAKFCKANLLPCMKNVRDTVDEIEPLIGKKFMSVPGYEDILYSVKY